MSRRKLITFDWALKRLLRSKANFDVLEGFLSELLKEDFQIQAILESESNQDAHEDKFNRVDLKVKNSKNEILIIEIQYERESDFLQRMLWSTSKAITEHLALGVEYAQVVKVISINIIHFDLGQGDDYIYHGTTTFLGLHTHSELVLDAKQKQLFGKETIAQLYPEYYLIKVNRFDEVAKDPLDQWIYFLKTGDIKEHFNAKGLKKAKDIFHILQLSETEREDFDRYTENMRYKNSLMLGSYRDGQLKGRAEGRAEGEQEKAKTIAKNLLTQGMSVSDVIAVTGLDQITVTSLKNEIKKLF